MKKFAGFTPQQQYTLLTKQGYQGPADEASMVKFLAASPAAAAKMGKYAQMAQNRLMKKSPVTGMAEGGVVTPTDTTIPETTTTTATPTTPTLESVWDKLKEMAAQHKASTGPAGATTPSAGSGTTEGSATTTSQVASLEGRPDTAAGVQEASIKNPLTIMTPATVAQAQNIAGAEIVEGTGQAGDVTPAQVSTVEDTSTAQTPDKLEAAKFEAQKVTPEVEQALAGTQAATGMVSEAGTVRGQMASLMADFENDGTPPWASGAMRNAMATMQARGLGASSLAGQAIVQAAMEAALPIAQQDAQTVAQFEMQNLNNEQQTNIFKTQQRIAGLFSDQAAQNAALQFNAASENQTNQFFADLQSTVSRFNAQQVNATLQFNAGQENAIEQFNTQQQNLREQFNAQNSLVIAQANAQWRQNLELTNTAAQNEANMANARAANGFTQTALDAIWQRERDLMAYAFQSSESEAERNLQILLADKGISAQKSASKAEGWGYLAGQVIGSDWAGDIISSFF